MNMRTVQNLFSSKSSRISRVLLSNPQKKWTIRKLASEAKIAISYTHAVVTTLKEQQYVVTENYKIALIDPIRLLRRWAASRDFLTENTILEYISFEKEVDEFYKKINNVRADYALTGLAGAWLVSPYVRPVTFDLYILDRRGRKEIENQLNLQPIEKGGNVRLVIPDDMEVSYGLQKIKKINIVSDIQLFVDLFNNPSRGEEASQSLLEKITKEWGKALTGDNNV